MSEAPQQRGPRAGGAVRESLVEATKLRAPRKGKFSPAQKQAILNAVDLGGNIAAVAKGYGVSRKTIYEWQNERKTAKPNNQPPAKVRRQTDALPPPLFGHELSLHARQALEDFEYFRWRYLGRRSRPWQVLAAEEVIARYRSPQTELGVINCPPGAGKSTLFTSDIPLWLICNDRTIRMLLGHNIGRIASQYAYRIRRSLERVRPLPLPEDRSKRCEGVLAIDFGRFKPSYQDVWRKDEFTVMVTADEDSMDESALEEKEPTVQAFGMGAEFLGTRVNCAFWDDLVTGDVLKTEHRIEDQRRWWADEGETRIEPGGLGLIVGQRMGQDDLMRFCLDQRKEDSDEPKYFHVVFPAHDDDNCHGEEFHGTDAPAQPEGCLLDPVRLPWRGPNGLLTHKANDPSKYEIQYQQRDVAASDVLVQKVWIDGGTDADGEHFLGCWDNHRSLCEWPRGLTKPYYSVVTADPSAANMWAVAWWLLHPASGQRFLLDLFNGQMQGSDLLDWNPNDLVHYGLLEEWAERAVQLKLPIGHVIVEANACQRWLMQFEHFKTWQRRRRVRVWPHTTGVNKLDPDLGLKSLQAPFKFGNIRLPGRNDGSRATVMPLYNEATKYEPAKPKARRTDCLMTTWFMEFHYDRICRADDEDKPPPRSPRPRWAAPGAQDRAQQLLMPDAR